MTGQKGKQMGKMVTRTIIESNVDFKIVNLEDMTIQDHVVAIAGKMEGKKLERKLEKMLAPGTKLISIEHVSYSKTLYGMEEQQFLELAQELPPRKNYDKGGEE